MLSVVIVVVITLLFSAFFSGMEIAFTTSNKLKLEIEKKNNATFNFIIDVFLRRPGQYITTMLVGNNIVLVLYSLNMSILLNMLAVKLGLQDSAGSVPIIIETLISTIIIIFVGEFIPKSFVRGNPNFFLRIFSVPLFIIYLILWPIAVFSTWVSVLLLRIFGLKVKSDHRLNVFERIDLEHLLEESMDNDDQHEEEHEIKIFRNALDFSDLRVRDCMVPRVEIEAVEIRQTIEELAERFVETNYSRIFIYDGSIDNIIGYVNTKSMFRSPKTIREILMDVDYVPESLSAQKLLTMFTKKNHTVAVVIDEFGGTAGIVSLEDVLEEIFGEIEDEHDEQDMVEKVVGENTFVLSCRLEVSYLNEKYGFNIPESDEYDTLAGYIIFYYEGIPNQGEIINIDNKEIKILRVAGSKLELARIRVF